MKKRTFFWLISIVFVGLIFWAVYDIMTRTVSPWERKKQREAQQTEQTRPKSVPKVRIKKDSLQKN